MSVTLDCHVSCDLSVEKNESTILRWVVLVISTDGVTLLFDELVELSDSFTAPFESIDLVEEQRRREARARRERISFPSPDSQKLGCMRIDVSVLNRQFQNSIKPFRI